MTKISIIYMVIAIFLAVITAAFPLANVIKPAKWKDITGLVLWCITISYLIFVGIYIGLTQ